MNYILNRVSLSLIILFSAAWGLSSDFIPDVKGFFEFRVLWVQFSGALTLMLASAGVILASRAQWLERYFSGIDKMYNIHRKMGVSVLSLGVFHWLLAKGTKWAVGWSWLPRPQFGSPPEREISVLESIFRYYRADAVAIGEWSFYLLVFCVVVALVPYFSYRFFQRLHRFMPLIYLGLIVHGVTVFNYNLWQTLAGIVILIAIFAGLFTLVTIGSRLYFGRKQFGGHVESFAFDARSKICHVTIKMDQPWSGHLPGQFVFLKPKNSNESHPFTLTREYQAVTNTLHFSIRSMGDFTDALPHRIYQQQQYTVEGPYGGFTFEDSAPQQIWVAGGIGITPFLAKLDQIKRSAKVNPKMITLFYVSQVADPEIMAFLLSCYDLPNVVIHTRIGQSQLRLTLPAITLICPGWRNASIWFCGPNSFGQEIKRSLAEEAFDLQNYHQELYKFR